MQLTELDLHHAAQSSLPASLKTWERALFSYVRKLRTMGAEFSEDLADRWWTAARPRIGGKVGIDRVRRQLERLWDKTTRTTSDGVLGRAVAAAQAAPPGIPIGPRTDPAYRVLAGVCVALQREAGSQAAFFLPQQLLSWSLNISQATVSRHLRALRDRGLLELVEEGSLESAEASEYRCLGQLLAEASGTRDRAAA